MSRYFKSQFRFRYLSYGHYRVIYFSPHGKVAYASVIDEMYLVDAVHFEGEPTQAAMARLAARVRMKGRLFV